MDGMKPFPTLDIAPYLDGLDTLPAGKLCLEFANTADWHASAEPAETLTSYDALVEWAARIGMRSEEFSA